MAQKAPGLTKIHISTNKSYLSEIIFGNILLDSIADYPVFFTVLTKIIVFSPIPHMVVPFILIPVKLQAQFQARESNR